MARLFIVASLFCACGGSAPAATQPKSHADDSQKSTGTDSTQEETPRRSTKVQCDDGSCFSCGEAVCLSGYYCSVGKTGHGCAWLPSCSGKPTCSCLTAAMREEPSCTCEEKEGGIFVACDGAKL